jgi:hypothetical protein
LLRRNGVPKVAIVKEAKALRTKGAFRLGDWVIMDFITASKLLIIDGVVSVVYRSSILSGDATMPEFATKKAEGAKFTADKNSAHHASASLGGRHTLVPFALEDGGSYDWGPRGSYDSGPRVVEYAVANRRLPARAWHVAPPSPAADVSL